MMHFQAGSDARFFHRNPKTFPAPLAPMPAAIRATQQTWLKQTIAQADALSPNDKQLIGAGWSAPLLAYTPVEKHWRITLGRDGWGQQIQFNGKNTWYIFQEHCQLYTQDGKPIDHTQGISSKGLALIQEFEGCRLTAYLDAVGVPTIGWGSTHGVYLGQCITQEQADEMLRTDLKPCEDAVRTLVKVPLTQGQFDALCSFVYNLGEGAFSQSTLLKLLNQQYYHSAADEFLRWNRAGGQILPGLTRRRMAERQMFLS